MAPEQPALVPSTLQPDSSYYLGACPTAIPNQRPVLTGEKEAKSAIRVEIYVADHCLSCEYAYEIAGTIEEKFPAVDLRIINLSQTTEPIPDAVFATPTYLLNGRLWSLGNPSSADIQARLSPEGQ